MKSQSIIYKEKHGKIINTLKREVKIINHGEVICVIPPSQEIKVTLFYDIVHVGRINNIPLTQTKIYGTSLDDIPEEDGVYYIVSGPVATYYTHCKNKRRDLLAVSGTIKNADKSIVGCRSLSEV